MQSFIDAIEVHLNVLEGMLIPYIHDCRATIAESLRSVTHQLHEAEAKSKHLLDLEADLDSREELFNEKVLVPLFPPACLVAIVCLSPRAHISSRLDKSWGCVSGQRCPVNLGICCCSSFSHVACSLKRCVPVPISNSPSQARLLQNLKVLQFCACKLGHF